MSGTQSHSAVHCSSSRDSRGKAQLFYRLLGFSRPFTSLSCERRGPGAVPCSPSNDGMQTAGQRNPGLTHTAAELAAQGGGREGGETAAVKEWEESGS